MFFIPIQAVLFFSAHPFGDSWKAELRLADALRNECEPFRCGVGMSHLDALFDDVCDMEDVPSGGSESSAESEHDLDDLYKCVKSPHGGTMKLTEHLRRHDLMC